MTPKTIEIPLSTLSTVPSGYDCPDGQLSASLGVISEDGSLRPLPPPRLKFYVDGGRLLLLHQVEPADRYVFIDSSGQWLSSCTCTDADAAEMICLTPPSQAPSASYIETTAINAVPIRGFRSATAFGTMIAVSSDDGMTYYRYDGGVYRPLGALPDLPLRFSLTDMKTYEHTAWCDFDTDITAHTLTESSQINTLTNCVWGCVNRVVADAHAESRFCFPFFVRAAYRMYDGSLVCHTAPVLMCPSSQFSCTMLGVPNIFTQKKVETSINGFSLKCALRNPTELADSLAPWSELITGIEVYVSAPFYPYDSSKDVRSWHDGPYSYYTVDLPLKEQDYASVGTFYHVADIDISASDTIPVDSYNMITDDAFRIRKGVLPSLVAGHVMPDDSHTHDRLSPSVVHSYNSRLHLADYRRHPYCGYRPETFVGNVSSYLSTVQTYTIRSFVRLSYPQGDVWVSSLCSGRLMPTPFSNAEGVPSGVMRGVYPSMLFYPDTNARQMILWITVGSERRQLSFDLSRHDFLNGAYFMITEGVDYPYTIAPDEFPHEVNVGSIHFPSTVLVSEVDNPFVYPSSVQVGGGRVTAMAAAVQALSQGQFGQYPLYAFTSAGVWAMQAATNGVYASSQPVSREVSLGAVAQTDSSVVFLSHRGVMMLSGAQCACLSERLDHDAFDVFSLPGLAKAIANPRQLSKLYPGTFPQLVPLLCKRAPQDEAYSFPLESFRDYTALSDCVLAYDGARQRLILSSPSREYSYVYSIRHATWGMMLYSLSSVAATYPFTLAMSTNSWAVDLSEAAVYNDGRAYYLVATRPLKFGDGGAFKNVRTAILRGAFPALTGTPGTSFYGSPVAVMLYGSRDGVRWHLVSSSQSPALRYSFGTPYRQYIFVAVGFLDPDWSLSSLSCSVMGRFASRLR